MLKQNLSGKWQFRQCGTDEWLPATVPGGVHTDLLALGRIPDPFVADNELKVMWIAESDWEYRDTFNANDRLFDEEKVALVCEGLDTIADVYINGTYLGHADNMFRRWEWDVKDLLRKGDNELHIVFGSPVRFVSAKQAQLPLQGSLDAILGGQHLRKAPCHFGWDWGPKLPPIGVWKEISLFGYSARFEDVHVRQELDEDVASVSVNVMAEAHINGEFKASITVTAPGGERFEAEEKLISFVEGELYVADLTVKIPNPKLWWPNGYGEQPLYQVKVTLSDNDGKLFDERIYIIGLRTIELCQDPDQWGKEFTFYVNGVRLFAKGADWIPTDSFPTRITESMLESLLKSAVDANMNMLRIWGGGYYPEDMFYDLCDRYGILIWQDFMFACGIYPADGDFFENVRVEAIENVRRLRHHAALAIWCGNNEMEQGWCDWGWNKPDDPLNQRLKDGYDRMFHHMLPELLEDEDPDHPYWPSSASSNTGFEGVNKQRLNDQNPDQPYWGSAASARAAFEGPNSQVQGDCHYWDVWHGRKPFTAYRTQYPRFMSEFGFQALPPLKTIATYADPADWNMTSYLMEHHQRSWVGNGLMVSQMTDTFRMPKDFPAMVYLSLLLQAEGIRYGVEHWRRNRNRVSGTLIWQLNDCWPVASWASLDYFGRWKALHYAAKRFYAPLLLSVEDQGKVMSVHVTSDLVEPVDVVVHWRLETLEGKQLNSGAQTLRAIALADTRVGVYDFSTLISAENQRKVVFVAEMWQDGKLISQSVTPFVANKHIELRKPGLKVHTQVEGVSLCITVSSRYLARFVELEIDGTDAVFSDNYFDIPAGTSVTVTTPLPENWSDGRTVQARSLYDSFA